MCPCCRGDHEIHRWDVLAATYKVCADEAIVLSAEIVEGEALIWVAERRDQLQVLAHALAVAGAVQEFSLGDRGQADALRTVGSQSLDNRSGGSIDETDADIGVQ